MGKVYFNESHMKNRDNSFEMLLSKAVWTLESFKLIFKCKPHTQTFLVATADLKKSCFGTVSINNVLT